MREDASILGLIDVGNWQSLVDMANGEQTDEPDHPRLYQLRQLIAGRPYPGEGDVSLDWQRDMALALIDFYPAQLLHLAYTQPLFAEYFSPLDPIGAMARQRRILQDIECIARAGGYLTLTVFCGGYMPLLGQVTDLGVQGLLESQPWGLSEADVTLAAPEDGSLLRKHPALQMVVAREEVLVAHPDAAENFISYLPDYIVNTRPGYILRGMNCHQPPMTVADISEERLPVLSQLGKASRVRDIPAVVKEALRAGKKVLFSVVEGYNAQQPPPDCQWLNNRDEWYCYRGLDLYLALMSGRPFWDYPLPPVLDRTKPKHAGGRWPLSGFFRERSTGCLGSSTDYTSAAVSSRSMLTHMVTDADISVECYCRDQSQMGMLAVFKPDKVL